jgi:hypothetical protein
VLERRKDPRRQRRWTAALDQLDQGVKVDGGLARQLLCKHIVEACLAQARATPRDGFSRPGASSGGLSRS